MPRHPLPALTSEETALEEVIDAELQPDRAHHDELGRTAADKESERSPREQPPKPLDLGKVDE